jgi:alpha-tubulin suppressor-like RCC1 family protein
LSRIPWPRFDWPRNVHVDVQMRMVAGSDGFFAMVDTSGVVWISGDSHVIPNNNCRKMRILSMQSPARIIFVATGYMHCMAVSSDLRVFGAGKNWSGQLGTGGTERRNQFSLIANGPWMGTTTMVACGACFSVILTEDGAVRTCGQYTSSCLGVTVADAEVEFHLPNVYSDLLEPTLIDVCNPGLTHPAAFKVEYIATGTVHVLAIADGTLFTWGQNCCGQLGTGKHCFSREVMPVRIGREEVFGSAVRLAAGNEHHTLVLTEDRQLWAFGNSEQGRLGLTHPPASIYVMSPQLVDAKHFGNGRISCIAAGKQNSGVLTDDGSLYTWGQGSINQWRSPCPSALGQPIVKNFQNVPLLVPQRCCLCVVMLRTHVAHPCCAPMLRADNNAFCCRTAITRSAGEQTAFGLFSLMPEDHILAFLMATHPRLGNKYVAKFLTPGAPMKGACAFLLVFRYDEGLLKMILDMTCTHLLPKAYDRLRGVRKMLGDPLV